MARKIVARKVVPFIVRIDPALHRKAILMAKRDLRSLNSYFELALSDRVAKDSKST